jgi:hypothetical protein
MNRQSVVVCALVLACTWPTGPLFAPPVNSVVSKLWRNFVKEEGPKVAEAIEKRQAARPAREATRSAEESIIAHRRIEETLKSEDFAVLFWITADKEIQARARAEAAELEQRLEKEASQIAKEERAGKCDLFPVLKDTLCYCLKAKIETDDWPDEGKLETFVADRLLKAGIECATQRVARRIATTEFGGLVAPAVKGVGAALAKQVMPPSDPRPEPSNTWKKAELLVLYAFCKS